MQWLLLQNFKTDLDFQQDMNIFSGKFYSINKKQTVLISPSKASPDSKKRKTRGKGSYKNIITNLPKPQISTTSA